MKNRICLISAFCAYSLVYGVTTATIDYRTYALGAAPKGVLAAFHDGPDTRGFSWETDTSVAISRVWILEASTAPRTRTSSSPPARSSRASTPPSPRRPRTATAWR